VRGSIKPFGVRLAGCSTPTFARQAAWEIPHELRPALVSVLRTIADLTWRIVKFERRIEHLAAEGYPETVRLRRVNGVGAITSLTFVLTLEDPKRFAKSRAVGAFLGLRPGRSQSGKRDPEMHITKAGDRDEPNPNPSTYEREQDHNRLRRLIGEPCLVVPAHATNDIKPPSPGNCACPPAPREPRGPPRDRGIDCSARLDGPWTDPNCTGPEQVHQSADGSTADDVTSFAVKDDETRLDDNVVLIEKRSGTEPQRAGS